MAASFLDIILTVLATSYVASFVATSRLLDDVRIWLIDRAEILAKGISCSFCVSFWAAAALTPFSQLDYTVTNVLAVAAGGAAVSMLAGPSRSRQG